MGIGGGCSSVGAMGKVQKKRRKEGTPPKYPLLAEAQRRRAKLHPRYGSRHWFQVSLRLSPLQVKMTARLVERENARRRALGLKANVSMGGIAMRWFEQGLARAVSGLAKR